MSNAIQAYTESTPKLQVPQRQDCYRKHVEVWRSWSEERGILSPLQAAREFFEWLNNDSHYRANSVRMYRQAVKNRLRLMALSIEDDAMGRKFERYLKQLDTDPATKAPRTASVAVTASKVLSEAEYTATLRTCRSERQRLYIRFLRETGCRVAEMTGLRLSDIEDHGEYVVARVTGKGNKEREVYVSTKLYTRIRQEYAHALTYVFETNGHKRLSESYVSNQIRRVTQKAIGRPLSAHKLRHTFAHTKIRETGRVDAVSRYLGHASVSTTLQYYSHDTLDPSDVLGAEVIQ